MYDDLRLTDVYSSALRFIWTCSTDHPRFKTIVGAYIYMLGTLNARRTSRMGSNMSDATRLTLNSAFIRTTYSSKMANMVTFAASFSPAGHPTRFT